LIDFDFDSNANSNTFDLSLGVRCAGANIIQETMKQGNSVALKADVGGKVVLAIYGFCDIRNFTDCTEVNHLSI
jgi:hypothetical protein